MPHSDEQVVQADVLHVVPCSCSFLSHSDISFFGKVKNGAGEHPSVGVLLYQDRQPVFNEETLRSSDGALETANWKKFPFGTSLSPAISSTICGPGCQAYTFLLECIPIASEVLKRKDACNIFIFGEIALWAVALFPHVFPSDSGCHLYVAHQNKMTVEECFDRCSGAVVWDPKAYEEKLVKGAQDLLLPRIHRTGEVINENPCFDIVINPSPTPRTLRRCYKVLSDEGVLLAGSQTCSQMVHNVAKLLGQTSRGSTSSADSNESLSTAHNSHFGPRISPIRSRLFLGSPECSAKFGLSSLLGLVASCEFNEFLSSDDITLPPVERCSFDELHDIMDAEQCGEVGGAYFVFDTIQ